MAPVDALPRFRCPDASHVKLDEGDLVCLECDQRLLELCPDCHVYTASSGARRARHYSGAAHYAAAGTALEGDGRRRKKEKEEEAEEYAGVAVRKEGAPWGKISRVVIKNDLRRSCHCAQATGFEGAHVSQLPEWAAGALQKVVSNVSGPVLMRLIFSCLVTGAGFATISSGFHTAFFRDWKSRLIQRRDAQRTRHTQSWTWRGCFAKNVARNCRRSVSTVRFGSARD